MNLAKRVSKLEANIRVIPGPVRNTWEERGRKCPRCRCRHRAPPDAFAGLTPEQIHRLPRKSYSACIRQ
jgi:hypothetical protein